MLAVALAAEEAAEQQETDWALHELGAAQLGAARRTARLVRLVRQLSRQSRQPQASLPDACGERATLKAA
jgi:hypothetical protein